MLGALGFPSVISELEVQKAVEELKKRAEDRHHLNIVKELWIHIPDLEKYVHVPIIRTFNIIEF
mgnify:CR=1 FL=1